MQEDKKKNEAVLFVPVLQEDIKVPYFNLCVTSEQLMEITKALNTLWRKRNANTQHMRRVMGNNPSAPLPDRTMSIYFIKSLSTAMNPQK